MGFMRPKMRAKLSIKVDLVLSSMQSKAKEQF